MLIIFIPNLSKKNITFDKSFDPDCIGGGAAFFIVCVLFSSKKM